LLEKFAHIRHARTTSAEVNSRRRFALLLRSIMADRAHNLGMQSRHRAPDDFRHSRNVGVRRIGIAASETDEPSLFLAPFGGSEGFVELFRHRRCYRTTSDRDAA